MTAELVEVPHVENVFDLDAVLAEREPKAPFVFRFGADTFSLPASPDLRAIAAFSAERLDEGFRILFGAEQWERLQASETVLDGEAFSALFEAYTAHVGEDLGESKASPKSSPRTAKR